MKKFLSIFILSILCVESAFACVIINKNGKKILKDRSIITLCSTIVYDKNNHSHQKYKKISGTFNELEVQLNYRDKILLSKHYNQHKSTEIKSQRKEQFWKTKSSGMIHRKKCHWYGRSKGEYTNKRKGKRCSFCF